jgi:large subunit ribosomal protein L30|tara:strand:- start:5167 stop:5349 length:183 start_codon:yes stop_codon:yes gene_type:complete
MKKIKIKQIASSLRRQPIQKKNLIGLGLNKVNKVVELEDTPSIRGMMNKVDHLIDVISEE